MLCGQGLGLPQFGPSGFSRIRQDRMEPGYLGDVEGEVVAPGLTPVDDHRRHLVLVAKGFVGIGLTLVPDHARDAIGHDRVDHRVVEDAGQVGLARRIARHLVEGGGQLHLPDIVQRNLLPVGALDEELLRGAVEAAVAVVVGIADDDHRLAGLDLRRRDRITARNVPYAIPPDQHAVPIGLVEIVDGAQAERKLLPRPGGGNLDLLAEPVDAVDARPELLHHRRQLDVAPARRVHVRPLPVPGHAFILLPRFAQQLHHLAPVGLLTLVRILGKRADLFQLLRILREIAKGTGAHPGFDDSAAPTAVDQAHGHFQRFMKLAAEVPGDGGEVAHGPGGR